MGLVLETFASSLMLTKGSTRDCSSLQQGDGTPGTLWDVLGSADDHVQFSTLKWVTEQLRSV